MMRATPTCLMLDRQADRLATNFEFCRAGNRIAARITMTATTTSNSIAVNERSDHLRLRCVQGELAIKPLSDISPAHPPQHASQTEHRQRRWLGDIAELNIGD